MMTSSSASSSTQELSEPLLSGRSGGKLNKTSIWPLVSSEVESGRSDEASARRLKRTASEKCDQAGKQDGACCCRELKVEERTLVDPDLVRDIVIGLSDGLTVPFALTAGLSSLGKSKFVVLAGIAELIAGAISMGVGGFLASQSERDHYRYLRHQTMIRVERSCNEEMEREVAEILEPIGVDEKACQDVARSLRELEVHVARDSSAVVRSNRNGRVSGDQEHAAGMQVWDKDVGLTAFLLKFGRGLEEVPDRRLYVSALTIGVSYLIGGLIPLLPYFFIPRAQEALIYSVIITGAVLLVFGIIKAHITGAGVGAFSYVRGAVSTLLVGGVAAGLAFGIVRALEKHEGNT